MDGLLLFIEFIFIVLLIAALYLITNDYIKSKKKEEQPIVENIKLTVGILSILLGLFLLVFAGTIAKIYSKEEVAVYNEYDYNINDVVDKFLRYDSKHCDIYFVTDESGIEYIKVERYLNIESDFAVYVYNFKLDKDYFDDQLRLYIQGQ